MKNLVKLLIVILMAVIYQIVHKQIEDNKINVEINENVEYLIYDNKKRVLMILILMILKMLVYQKINFIVF